MYDPFRFTGTDQLIQDRFAELRQVTIEVHAAPRPDGGRANPVARTRALVGRTRSFIGRRLVWAGSAVAGQHS